MKLLNKLMALKKDKKGFTLIEIVIVIVIIAILAAMLVPSMLSWIDSANKRTFLSAADTIKTSVTSQITNKYANNETVTGQGSFVDKDWNAVSDLVGKTVKASGADYNVTFSCTGNKISTMTISNTKYKVVFTGGSSGTWGEVEPVTPAT